MKFNIGFKFIIGFLLLFFLSGCKEKLDEDNSGEASFNDKNIKLSTSVGSKVEVEMESYLRGLELTAQSDGKSLQENISVSTFKLSFERQYFCNSINTECNPIPPDPFLSVFFTMLDFDSPVATWVPLDSPSIEGFIELTEISETSISGIFQLEVINDDGAEFGYNEIVKITDGSFKAELD